MLRYQMRSGIVFLQFKMSIKAEWVETDELGKGLLQKLPFRDEIFQTKAQYISSKIDIHINSEADIIQRQNTKIC